jgi:hypothetical protein
MNRVTSGHGAPYSVSFILAPPPSFGPFLLGSYPLYIRRGVLRAFFSSFVHHLFRVLSVPLLLDPLAPRVLALPHRRHGITLVPVSTIVFGASSLASCLRRVVSRPSRSARSRPCACPARSARSCSARSTRSCSGARPWRSARAGPSRSARLVHLDQLVLSMSISSSCPSRSCPSRWWCPWRRPAVASAAAFEPSSAPHAHVRAHLVQVLIRRPTPISSVLS